MITEAGAQAIIDSLARVAPDELNARAALLVRNDRKYIVAPQLIAEVIASLHPRVRALDVNERRRFPYESLYFDTLTWHSYLFTARRRPDRFKVRTRAYLHTGRCALEVKVKNGRGQTVKHRIDYDLAARQRLDSRAHAFLGEFTQVRRFAALLVPAVTTSYERTTLLIDGASRATIDFGVHATTPDGRALTLGDAVVVETKSLGAASALDRELWSRGVRPATLSKFGTGLAAHHPELPANKWHRTLQRHPWAVAAER